MTKIHRVTVINRSDGMVVVPAPLSVTLDTTRRSVVLTVQEIQIPAIKNSAEINRLVAVHKISYSIEDLEPPVPVASVNPDANLKPTPALTVIKPSAPVVKVEVPAPAVETPAVEPAPVETPVADAPVEEPKADDKPKKAKRADKGSDTDS